ncbi:MAG: Ig-like domain-containing protein [Luteolibacter sp.]
MKLKHTVIIRIPLLAIAALALSIPASHAQSVYQGSYTTSWPNNPSEWPEVTAFETKSGKGLSIINIFRLWGEEANNSWSNGTMNKIRNHGSIPMVTWQPENDGSDQSQFTLQKILDGQYDEYIDGWATAAKTWGYPFFLRFAHEMNAQWYPWCEVGYGTNQGNGKYVEMWRYVHDRFTALGVKNVTWVWCVNKHYSGSITPLSRFYPGDQYVDWIAIDAYNRGTTGSYNWTSFIDLIDPSSGASTYDDTVAAAPGKPVMIAEAGCNDVGGDKALWFQNALKTQFKNYYPRIKAWCYFNADVGYTNNITATSQAAAAAGYNDSMLNSANYYAGNSYALTVQDTLIQPLTSDAMPAPDSMPPFVSIVSPSAATLYKSTSPKIVKVNASDKSAIQKVEFYVDGVLTFTDTLPPYEFNWVINGVGYVNGSTHAVTAKAFDNQPTNHNNTTSTLSVVIQP